jgi:hypothetical protein
MLPNRDLSHINNLQQLRAAKKEAIQEIEIAERQLEETFSKMPMRAVGSLFGFVTGLVSKGIHGSSQNTFGASGQQQDESTPLLKSGLQAIGIELAMLGITKLVSKLLGKKKG